MPSIKTSSDSSPGERFDLLTSTDREKSFRHTQRYRTCALEYKGIVLDLGAGYGYGDRIIRENPAVTKVQMVDKDGQGLVQRGVLPGCLHSVENRAYDTVTAIEFIEHLDQQEQFELVAHVYRILRSGGVFVISTPMASKSGPNHYNKWHKWELTMADLYTVLGHQWSTMESFTLGNPKLTTGINQPIMFAVARKHDRVWSPLSKSYLRYG